MVGSVYIDTIVGSGIYALPESDADLYAAESGIDSILRSVSGLIYVTLRCQAMVYAATPAVRRLDCVVQDFSWGGDICPDAAAIAVLQTTVNDALMADVDISSIGNVLVSSAEQESNDRFERYEPQTFFDNGLVALNPAKTLVDVSSIVGARRVRMFISAKRESGASSFTLGFSIPSGLGIVNTMGNVLSMHSTPGMNGTTDHAFFAIETDSNGQFNMGTKTSGSNYVSLYLWSWEPLE